MAGYKGMKDRAEPPEKIPQEKMSVWELIKTGAIILAIIVILKICWDLLVRFGGFLKRVWGKIWALAKANTIVFVAIPLGIAALAMLFPESGRIFYSAADSLARDLDDLLPDLPRISGTPPVSEPPVDLTPLSELRGCTITMKYLALESGDEQRCIDVCRDREYESYAIVRDDGAYECYCCHGAGKPVE